MKTWTVDQDHDIRVVSWRVVELIYGEDDGSMERDDIECQIQEVIAASFDFTTVRSGERSAAPSLRLSLMERSAGGSREAPCRPRPTSLRRFASVGGTPDAKDRLRSIEAAAAGDR
jgi:hypothetical protein